MQLFVPGRICLFGEHSDWAAGYRRVDPDIEKGYTLICGTEQGIHAEVEPLPDVLRFTATTPAGERLGPIEMPLDAKALLLEAQRGGFWSYVAGVAYQATVHHRVRGLAIHNFQTDLPIKKGLSSSAAICVLVARAFNRIYDLKLTTRGEMELAYQGEITTPSRCGRMDQGCAFGRRPVLMTFDGDQLHTTPVRAGTDLHLVVVDLQAQKDTKKILADLNRCYPCADGEVAWGVRELLGQINKSIVHRAVEALAEGDAGRLGRLMAEAQSFFDHYALPACPEELRAPALHRVLDYAPLEPHVWGGKGVGSQGDGTAQFIARSRADQQAIVDILENELSLPCLKLTIPAQTGDRLPATVQPRLPARLDPAPAGGEAQPIRKAVVPAAGLGTRLYPASRATKKELFPIVDSDGIAKPAIQLIVEEALAASIEEVILVVQEEDLARFRSLFAAGPLADLPPHLQAHARHLAELGRHLTYAIQASQEGFGHAVYQARQAVAGEPFLLMLGDHVYRSANERACARQVLDVYAAHGANVLGLRRTPEADVVHYGTVAGTRRDGSGLLEVSRLVEKPTVEEARRYLRIAGLPRGEYLTLFGLYVLKPQVFGYLADQIDHDSRRRGEIQLTPALDRLRAEHGFLGVEVQGQSFDIGLPESYLETLEQFRNA